MELEELQSRMEHLRHLESRANCPETPQKAYLTMDDSEKNRYIEFLLQQKAERDRAIADKDAFIKNLQETLDMLKSMHESDSKKIDEMLSKINDLTAQLKLKNKQTYADKSQKGISKESQILNLSQKIVTVMRSVKALMALIARNRLIHQRFLQRRQRLHAQKRRNARIVRE